MHFAITAALVKGWVANPAGFRTNADGNVFPITEEGASSHPVKDMARHREIVAQIAANTKDPEKKAKHEEYLAKLDGAKEIRVGDKVGELPWADADLHYMLDAEAAPGQQHRLVAMRDGKRLYDGSGGRLRGQHSIEATLAYAKRQEPEIRFTHPAAQAKHDAGQAAYETARKAAAEAAQKLQEQENAKRVQNYEYTVSRGKRVAEMSGKKISVQLKDSAGFNLGTEAPGTDYSGLTVLKNRFNKYSVAHTASGIELGSYDTALMAKHHVAELQRSGVDWTLTAGELQTAMPHIAHASAIVRDQVHPDNAKATAPELPFKPTSKVLEEEVTGESRQAMRDLGEHSMLSYEDPRTSDTSKSKALSPLFKRGLASVAQQKDGYGSVRYVASLTASGREALATLKGMEFDAELRAKGLPSVAETLSKYDTPTADAPLGGETSISASGAGTVSKEEWHSAAAKRFPISPKTREEALSIANSLGRRRRAIAYDIPSATKPYEKFVAELRREYSVVKAIEAGETLPPDVIKEFSENSNVIDYVEKRAGASSAAKASIASQAAGYQTPKFSETGVRLRTFEEGMKQLRGIAKVAEANSRYGMNGVYIDRKLGQMVATDGHRLAFVPSATETLPPKSQSGYSTDLWHHKDNREVQADFPSYQDSMPEGRAKTSVSGSALASVITAAQEHTKDAAKLGRDSLPTVYFFNQGDKLMASHREKDQMLSAPVGPALAGLKGYTAYNAQYINDALKLGKRGSDVRFEMDPARDSLAPLLIRTEDGAGTLIMPIRVDQNSLPPLEPEHAQPRSRK